VVKTSAGALRTSLPYRHSSADLSVHLHGPDLSSGISHNLCMAQAGVASRGEPFRVVELPVISGDKPNRTIAGALVSRSAAHDLRPYA
jgi:hypothetical protein